jgi:prolyl-tRNA editing enzyme YbaK/EbsC (Cys-tRNA(Pro) deacylase)
MRPLAQARNPYALQGLWIPGSRYARPGMTVIVSHAKSRPMSLASVRAFFAERAPDIAVIESDASSATVALAAQAYGVEPSRIAKTLSLRIGERVVLIVASGTSRMDNKKVKRHFGGKPKMLDAAEVAGITGHEVGGVCPFGLKTPLPVYCDISLQAFDEVVPAAGSTHSAVRIAPARMAELVAAEWVDVCGERVNASGEG